MINIRPPISLVSALVVLLLCSAPAMAQQVRTVMLRAHEIAVREDDGAIRQLTNDGLGKTLPTWSKDGTKIAYIEREAGGGRPSFDLKVIGPSGQQIYQSALHSNQNDVADGIRFPDSLEWIAADKIVVSGSINPTTSEYEIFDLHAGAPLASFFDDGVGAAFSPDGAHYAYITGSPHFTPITERAPVLEVDGRVLFSKLDPNAKLGPMLWSPDGTELVLATAKPAGGPVTVYVWRQGKMQTFSIATRPTNTEVSLFWSDADLIMALQSTTTGMTTDAWRVVPAENVLQPVPLEAVGGTRRPAVRNPAEEARALAFLLRHDIEAAGGRQPDFWCATCAFRTLPRRSDGKL